MSIVKSVSRLTQLSARQITTSSANKCKLEVDHEGLKRFKELQKKYQLDDGKPIHLKRPGDKALMYITFLGCAVGVAGSFKMIYDLS